MLLILENILAQAGVPFLHQLPPADGGVPDALFHFGGDDEAATGLQVKMSEVMKSLGLPYHVNVMLGKDGDFHFTAEDRAVYESRGHEFSLHFNFISYPEGAKHPAPIEEREYERQFRLFVERYGTVPVCTNNHFCRASGWADSPRFGARRGIKGENHLLHHAIPPMDPVNLFGCPFGTVYPFFVYDDAEHGNERLDFVSIPIGLYEPGSIPWEQSHPFHGQDAFKPEEYRRVVDLALAYGWTLNVFVHPTHMHAQGSRTRDALCAMLDRIAERNARVVHFGTDALCLWWHERSRSRVLCAGAGTYAIETGNKAGVLVRFLEESLPAEAKLELDGREVQCERRMRRGKPWVYVFVPQGSHLMRIV
jgi:hypothetical protein